LINNAGGGYIESEDGLDFLGWEKTYKINVLVPMQLSKLLVKNMSLSESPQIFIITSLAGHFMFRGSRPEYTIAKHAESTLSNVLRLELANKNIRVTEICPGTVNSKGKSENALETQDIADAIFWCSQTSNYVNIDLIRMSHIKNTII
jgi:NADP-dependent 3-hydroxy acid dehydrogenase YdfG